MRTKNNNQGAEQASDVTREEIDADLEELLKRIKDSDSPVMVRGIIRRVLEEKA